ncbi:MAG: hypothetical protein ACRD1H_13930, partial [Vicinamibacterales bacterium]
MPELLFDLVVANLSCGFLQLARGVARFAGNLTRGAIQLPLEALNLLFQLIFLLSDGLRPGRALGAGGWKIPNFVGDLALLACDLFGLALRVLDIAFGARAL